MRLILKPQVPGINEALQNAFIKYHPQYAGDTKPPRRIKHEFRISNIRARPELIRECTAGKVEYQLNLNPENLLIGMNALSSGFLHPHISPLTVAVFKAVLKNYLPSLDEDVLASLSEDDFRTSHLTTCKYVKFDTETQAYQALMNVLMHCKITFDSGCDLPKRKSGWKKPMPIVISDATARNSFRIVLPYGDIKVFVIREHDEYPETLQDLKDTDQRIAMRANMRTLLCFELTNDLVKFRYQQDKGNFCCLPEDHRNWNPEFLPKNPNTLFWNQACYEMWLNVELATTEEEICREGLARDQEQILDAYLAGKSIFSRGLLPERFDDAKAIHEALATKAGVNILIPWAINKLHKGKRMRELLDHSNLFDPGTAPDFQAHALSKQNVKDAITAFSASMDGIAGWQFKPQK